MASSVLGGEPRRWLPNASGLAWLTNQRLLFSEKIRNSQGNHMKIVAADESRASARDVYVPMPGGAMARSFPSPDGSSTLAAEMDDRGKWLPCRLIPVDGRFGGQAGGPPGTCWYAAWSPDGKWLYLSANAGDGFHICRQRFPATGALTELQQIASGPTQEDCFMGTEAWPAGTARKRQRQCGIRSLQPLAARFGIQFVETEALARCRWFCAGPPAIAILFNFPSEEAEEQSVRRPERPASAIRARQFLSCLAGERTQRKRWFTRCVLAQEYEAIVHDLQVKLY